MDDRPMEKAERVRCCGLENELFDRDIEKRAGDLARPADLERVDLERCMFFNVEILFFMHQLCLVTN